MTIPSAIRTFLGAHGPWLPRAPIVVGVSGGPDSLCLLHVLRALAPELGITLHVAHLDHMIRAEAAAEAQFVADLAQAWGLPATIARADVPALARAQRLNLHAAGRQARYALLARVARACGAQAVAVAHHANDQAETVLLHLLRGAGPEGLSGMRAVVPWDAWGLGVGSWELGEAPQAPTPNSQLPAPGPALIRPLLGVERADIEAYCAAQHLAPRADPSNDDLAAARNRIRHDLLPRLIEYNPHIIAALGHTAQICAEEHAFLAAALDAAWPGLAHVRPAGVDFDGATWRALHPALQRAALRRAYALLGGADTLGFAHTEQARALAGQGVGGRAELPGGMALRVGYGGALTLGAPAELDAPQLIGDMHALPAPGRLALAAGWALLAEHALPPPPGPWVAALDPARLDGPLLVRRRRPGDRMQLAVGSRRLQDLLVDAKVPRALRAAWPLVATPSTIVWAPGLRVAPAFLAQPGAAHALVLRVVQEPGSEQR